MLLYQILCQLAKKIIKYCVIEVTEKCSDQKKIVTEVERRKPIHFIILEITLEKSQMCESRN